MQSVATYGMEINSIRENPEPVKGSIQDLQVIVNEQARRTTGTFKTTPEGFLMAEGAMKPAEAIWERRTMHFQARQVGRPKERGGKQNRAEEKLRNRCLDRLEVKDRKVETTKPRKEEEILRGKVVISTKEEVLKWANPQEEEGEIRIYTDGIIHQSSRGSRSGSCL